MFFWDRNDLSGFFIDSAENVKRAAIDFDANGLSGIFIQKDRRAQTQVMTQRAEGPLSMRNDFQVNGRCSQGRSQYMSSSIAMDRSIPLIEYIPDAAASIGTQPSGAINQRGLAGMTSP